MNKTANHRTWRRCLPYVLALAALMLGMVASLANPSLTYADDGRDKKPKKVETHGNNSNPTGQHVQQQAQPSAQLNGSKSDEKLNVQQNGEPKHVNEEKTNASGVGKVTICHRTGSATNPYVMITISMNAWTSNRGNGGHFEVHIDGSPPDDVLPINGSCPTTIPVTPGTVQPPVTGVVQPPVTSVNPPQHNVTTVNPPQHNVTTVNPQHNVTTVNQQHNVTTVSPQHNVQAELHSQAPLNEHLTTQTNMTPVTSEMVAEHLVSGNLGTQVSGNLTGAGTQGVALSNQSRESATTNVSNSTPNENLPLPVTGAALGNNALTGAFLLATVGALLLGLAFAIGRAPTKR